MSNKRIWDFWAKYYERLWVQKISLEPTRKMVIEEISKYVDDKNKYYNILDIGCGTGQTLFEIIKKFEMYKIKIKGIDFSEEMIKEANLKKMGINYKNGEVDFLQIDVNNLNIINDKFDIIICTHSFPYYKNQKRVIESIEKMLNNDGIIVFVQASINNLYDRIAMFFVKLTTGNAKYLSIKELGRVLPDYLRIDKLARVNNIWFMPSIYLFLMKRVTE